jgi:flavin-dependent dehydrogenase
VIKGVDVVVVGAGPAGFAAGIVFARNSLQTLVIEKKGLPVDKACGEGVLPPGIPLLDGLGVSKYLSPGDHWRIAGIEYRSPGGFVARGEFQSGVAWGVSRLALSEAFRSRAREINNLEIIAGSQVKTISRCAGRILIESGEDIFSTRLLVGADGIHSMVRRWAGLDGPPPSIERWGIRQHFSIAPWSDFVEVHWKKGVEAYITPCGKDCVGITFLIDRGSFSAYPNGKQLFASLVDSFPSVKSKVARAKPLDPPLAAGPLQRRVKSTIADGVLLIGDAAGYLDAITGDGISLALAQAAALEETVIPILRKVGNQEDGISAPALSKYAAVHKAIVARHSRKTNLVLLLVRFPSLVDPVIAALERYPRLFRRLIP